MQQQIIRVAIPDDLVFSDLNLARRPEGISFNWAAVERVCQASGLQAEMFRDSPEDNVFELIIGWYQAHRQHGGNTDPVVEELFAEVLAEEKAGQKFSHRPGRA